MGTKLTLIDMLCTINKINLKQMADEFAKAAKYGKLYTKPSKTLEGVGVDEYEGLRDAFINVYKTLTPLFKNDDVKELKKQKKLLISLIWILQKYQNLYINDRYTHVGGEKLKKRGLREQPKEKKLLNGHGTKSNAISREEYVKLVKKLHPDKGGGNEEFAILSKLYDKDVKSPAEFYNDLDEWNKESDSLKKVILKEMIAKEMAAYHKHLSILKGSEDG